MGSFHFIFKHVFKMQGDRTTPGHASASWEPEAKHRVWHQWAANTRALGSLSAALLLQGSKIQDKMVFLLVKKNLPRRRQLF